MNFRYTVHVAFFSIALSLSSISCMDREFDAESGLGTEMSLGSETSTSYSALDQINPVNRKRSAWTNFYVAVGGCMGSGIGGSVLWHLAKSLPSDKVDDATPIVYIVGTAVASIGICCYFATLGANILHNTCKKGVKEIKALRESQDRV